jgi:predicted Zn-dependent protease
MAGLFYNLGRGLGYASIPAIRKSKWVWKSLTGDAEESLQAEAEFGRALAGELRLKTGTSHDAEDLALVRGIGQRLGACVRNKLRAFKVDILLETEPTAMALPGGFIFLTPALLNLAERNPDEVAFVIGHEMAHVIRGHALDRVLARIGTEGVSRILSRGLLSPALRETGLKWLESAHSRENETEADEFGVRVAAAAGYNAGAAVTLLERLAALRDSSREIPAYFASHPPEAERIASVKAALATIRTPPHS